MFYLLYFQAQFVITCAHALYATFTDCDYPLWGKNLISGYTTILFILFMNFYLQSYVNRKRAAVHKYKDDNDNNLKGGTGISNKTTNGTTNGEYNMAAKGNKSDKKVK